MKYSFFNYLTSIEDIGYYPQIVKASSKTLTEDELYDRVLSKFDNAKEIDFTETIILKMHTCANLTDIMPLSNLVHSKGFLIKSSCLPLLTKKVSNCTILKNIIVEHSRSKYDYAWIQPIYPSLSIIDFPKSEFKTGLHQFTLLDDIDINSEDEYIKAFEVEKENFRRIFITKACFKNTMASDLLILPNFLHDYIFISEKLIEAFQEAGISGYELIKPNVVFP